MSEILEKYLETVHDVSTVKTQIELFVKEHAPDFSNEEQEKNILTTSREFLYLILDLSNKDLSDDDKETILNQMEENIYTCIIDYLRSVVDHLSNKSERLYERYENTVLRKKYKKLEDLPDKDAIERMKNQNRFVLLTTEEYKLQIRDLRLEEAISGIVTYISNLEALNNIYTDGINQYERIQERRKDRRYALLLAIIGMLFTLYVGYRFGCAVLQ